MKSLLLACSVVVPMLVYMVVGGIIRKAGIFSQDKFRALNSMLFKVFIPLSLFFSVYSVDLKAVIVPNIFAYCLLMVILVAIAGWYLVGFMIRNRKDRATVAQGIYRSNFVLFGGAIAASLCDAEGTALSGALAAVVIPLYNVIAVILFELVRGGKIYPKRLIINIFKNPLVDAGILGMIFSFFQLKLPEMIESPLNMLGKCATPMALVALGGILSFGSLISHKKELFIAVLGRLVIVPVIGIGIGILLGFRGNELIAILAVFASPTAVSSAPMAQQMGGNGDLAGEIVAMTSVFCILTIFIFVWILSRVGFI